MNDMTNRWIGQRTIRPDGADKVTGRAQYSADFSMPGMIWGKMLRSPHAHARIRGIDTSKAEALPGVKAVVTAKDVVDFPLDKVRIRSKTGSAEVYGKQSTSWVASYDKRYVVVMMVSQGGTGSGTSGPAIRKIWEALYGIDGTRVDTSAAALPGARPPVGLPQQVERFRIGNQQLRPQRPER